MGTLLDGGDGVPDDGDKDDSNASSDDTESHLRGGKKWTELEKAALQAAANRCRAAGKSADDLNAICDALEADGNDIGKTLIVRLMQPAFNRRLTLKRARAEARAKVKEKWKNCYDPRFRHDNDNKFTSHEEARMRGILEQDEPFLTQLNNVNNDRPSFTDITWESINVRLPPDANGKFRPPKI